MEGKDAEIQFTPEGKQSILTKVIHAEQWEKFLARKYVGTKRFGLDGGEGAVPALEAVIKYGGQMGVDRDRRRHGAPRPAQHPDQRHGQAGAGDLPRIRRRRDQPGRRRRLGRRQISPRHFVGPRVRRQQGASVAAAQPVAPRSGRPGRARQGARGADDQRRQAGQDRPPDAAPRRRRLRRPGRGVGMPELLRPARLRHRRHDPFHHQQPGRLHDQPAVRRARRLIRRTSPRASRRRSCTSTATIPKRSPSAASSRPSSARPSAATSSSTCGAIAASATTRATSRASPSR